MKVNLTLILLGLFSLGVFAQESEGSKKTEVYIKSTFGPSKGFMSDRITESFRVQELPLWTNYEGIGFTFSAYTREYGLGFKRGNKYLEIGAQESAYVFRGFAPAPDLSGPLVKSSRFKIWQIPLRFGVRNRIGNSKMAYCVDAGVLITTKSWREGFEPGLINFDYYFSKTDSLGNTQEAFFYSSPVRKGVVYENNSMNMIMLSPALRLGLEYQVSDRVGLGCLFSLVGNGTDEMYEVQAGYKTFDGEEETIIFINDGGYKSFAISLKVNLFEFGE